MQRTALPVLVLGFLAGCSCNECDDAPAPGPPVVEAAQLAAVPNVHVFGDIATAGQPAADDFGPIVAAGYRSVLNLRHAEELQGLDEAGLATSLGLEYVSVPWNGLEQLTDDVFDRCRAVLETAERPLFVHCGSANRVGAVWIPWRVLDEGASFEEALAEAKTIGLRTPGYEERAREYIESRR